MTEPMDSTEAGGHSPADVLARSLRAHRLRAGLSQEDLAYRTQLSVRAIANIEAGRVRRPHGYSLRKLADGLDLTGSERESLLRWPRPTAVTPEGPAAGEAEQAPGVVAAAGRGWTAPPPRQLPRDVGDFTGRADEMQQISAFVTSQQWDSPPVAVISGQGGIGKTATAVKIAHMVATAFPDGQLFADLGGLSSPQDPAVVLGWFLRALGVEASSVPDEVAERTVLFRSLAADRRILVVLDNAAGADQVRPLLPGTGACATIVTSRDRLDAVESAQRFDLQLFSVSESLALLGSVLTARRVEAERAAAHEIVRSCGHLPLAVRIAAARLAAHPKLSLRTYARGIADERRRLDELRLGDLAVRATIQLSYAALDRLGKVALRRLGLVTLTSFSPWVLAPLIDADLPEAAATADQLAQRRLLEVVGTDPSGEPRYRMHDLVRLFALGRLQDEDDEQERLAALARALGQWLVIAEIITDCLPTTSDLASVGDGPRWDPPTGFVAELRRAHREWFRIERMNLAAAVKAAAARGLHDQASQIAGSMASACLLYGDYDILSPALDTAIQACRAAGNHAGEATTLAAMGRLRQELCDLDGAHRLFQEAHAGFERVGDERGQAFAAVFLADTLRGLQQQHNGPGLAEAARWGSVAYALCEKLDDPARTAEAGYALGKIHVAQGEIQAAHDCFQAVLALGDRLAKPIVRAHALFQLGRIARTSHRFQEAMRAYRDALDIVDRLGDQRSVAFIAYELATAEAEEGDVEHAVWHAERAVEIYQRLRVGERMHQAKDLLDDLRATRA